MWEYAIVEETDIKKLVQKMNEFGRENWEALGFTSFPGAFGKIHFVVVLKRQKEK
jgi:hypothetical protein